MPLPTGTRYRMKKTSKGMVRLAFAKGSNKVIETKNMKTGDTHMMMKKMRGRKR